MIDLCWKGKRKPVCMLKVLVAHLNKESLILHEVTDRESAII